MKTEIRKQYWSNGNLSSKRSYLNGIQDGCQKYYHTNGRLRSEYLYKKNNYYGIYQNWLFNGTRERIVKSLGHGPSILFRYELF